MSAADKLLGLSLANDWRVTKHIARNPNGTGGTFSQSYLVERDVPIENGKTLREVGFLKAFDFWEAFEPDVDTAAMIAALTNAYNHEREILAHCDGRRLSNVVIAVDHGKVTVPGLGKMEGTVFYLIFDVAEGDVRVQMSTTTRRGAAWCMKALRDISLGLWQVHKELIAHQDAKPSNVLTYAGPSFRVADFGRSSQRGRAAPHDHLQFAGDWTYAPPELQYGQVHSEFVPRRIGCDIYMLGNLAAFLFSGTNVTASLMSRLDPQHHPARWGGTYEQVLPYVRTAFSQVLSDLRPLIDEPAREPVLTLISELCDPDLAKRGHPRGLGRGDSQYSLERYVALMDRLHKELEMRARIASRKAA